MGIGSIAVRVQRDVAGELAYPLTRRQRRKLARATTRGHKIKLRVDASASGGGGTDSASASSVRRKKRK